MWFKEGGGVGVGVGAKIGKRIGDWRGGREIWLIFFVRMVMTMMIMSSIASRSNKTIYPFD